MAHYALLDENDIVTQVIVGRNENEVVDGISNWEEYYGNFHNQKCLRTSYNTHGGVHLLGGSPLRKNFASIGYTYDQDRDAFIPPKPFDSWILDETTCGWDAPVPYPNDDGSLYRWNEDSQSWDVLEEPSL